MSDSQKTQISGLLNLIQVIALFFAGYWFNTLNADITTLKKNVQDLEIKLTQVSVKIDFLPKNQLSQMNTTLKSNPTVYDTVNLVKQVAYQYQHDSVITDFLKAIPFQNNIPWFDAMFNHIKAHTNYAFDMDGFEQIKTPNRFVLIDKKGDCDDYTVFWGALLNRAKVKWAPKIVKYNINEGFAHIYPIVYLTNNEYITLDNVVGVFNKEVNHVYSEIL